MFLCQPAPSLRMRSCQSFVPPLPPFTPLPSQRTHSRGRPPAHSSQACHKMLPTLVVSLLQPPPEVMFLFDDVIVMAQG